MKGKSRKCLILDLDNTLWGGGVIGDDGLAGIRLGQGDAVGEAFIDVQRMVLALRQRGIVLAVCSKNDPDTARLPFRHHPEMLIKETDIAVFVANWQPKSDNIRAIAEALNLGLDALVLLDDNPVERAEVRRALPLVAVPEIPDDPAFYPSAIFDAGYFETVQLTSDDLQRAEQYRTNVQRAQSYADAGDLETFLTSLDMVAELSSFRSEDLERVTQLINKTNQFNLTTRRHDASTVWRFSQPGEHFTMQVRLRDRFGDNGIISVLIVDRVDGEWEIDTWVMSCRVFNRRIEHMIMNQLVLLASARGIERLTGRYLPTERNAVVKDLYAEMGFEAADHEGVWRLDIASYQPHSAPITVHWSDRSPAPGPAPHSGKAA
jgi:FkbH-like protein